MCLGFGVTMSEQTMELQGDTLAPPATPVDLKTLGYKAQWTM